MTRTAKQIEMDITERQAARDQAGSMEEANDIAYTIMVLQDELVRLESEEATAPGQAWRSLLDDARTFGRIW